MRETICCKMLKQVFTGPMLAAIGRYVHDPSSHTVMLLMDESKSESFEPLVEQKEEDTGVFCIEENNFTISVKCKDTKKNNNKKIIIMFVY